MRQLLIEIASHLTTHRESKNHGGYLIYREPGKIEIYYDTYYPSVAVHVWVEGERKLAAHFSGRGTTEEYHGGEWESYVRNVIYPRVAEAKELQAKLKEEREKAERLKRSARLNDSSTFSAA